MRVIYSIGGCTFAGPGIGQTAYQGARAFFRQGVLKKLIVADFGKSEIPDHLIETVPVKTRGLRRLIGEPRANWVKDSWFDFWAASRVDKCDIFHGWAGMSLRSLKKAKELDAVTVLQRASSHILNQNRLLKEEYEQWGIKYLPILPKIIERQLQEYKTTDYVLVPSEFAKTSFIAQEFPRERLLLVPFGVDDEEAKIKNEKLKGSDKNSKFKVLFVGQIGLRKGIFYLLQAWKELNLKKDELILVGNVEKIFKKKVLPRFSDLQNIRFTGFQDPTPYYQSADVFVFPSIEEGSALATYEALGYGLPVITTFNSGSVVRDGLEGFIVPIRDVKILKEKILQLHEDSALRQKLSEGAIQRAKLFSWYNHGENLVKKYQRILEGRR